MLSNGCKTWYVLSSYIKPVGNTLTSTVHPENVVRFVGVKPSNTRQPGVYRAHPATSSTLHKLSRPEYCGHQ